jgi:hypothetical protein
MLPFEADASLPKECPLPQARSFQILESTSNTLSRTSLLATTFTGYHSTGFLLWGFVKDQAYASRVPGHPALLSRIRDVIATVTSTS